MYGNLGLASADGGAAWGKQKELEPFKTISSKSWVQISPYNSTIVNLSKHLETAVWFAPSHLKMGPKSPRWVHLQQVPHDQGPHGHKDAQENHGPSKGRQEGLARLTRCRTTRQASFGCCVLAKKKRAIFFHVKSQHWRRTAGTKKKHLTT